MGDRLKQSTDQRSFVMIYHDFLRSDKLTAKERLIFIYLRMHAGQGNTAFPSLSTLEKETKLSKKTIQRCIESMQEKGVIDVDRRHSEDSGGNISNLYTLHDKADTWSTDKKHSEIHASQEKQDILIKEVSRLKAENEHLRALVEKLSKEKEPSSTTADQSKVDDDSKRIDKYSNRQHTSKPGERQPQDTALKKRNGNKFCDFQQRDNDYDAIERQLIRQQLGEHPEGFPNQKDQHTES